MKMIRKIFSFSFIFGVSYILALYGVLYSRVYFFDSMSGVVYYSIIPIVSLLLIFLASYLIGKKHDLLKTVWATSISILSGLAIGTSLAFIITFSYSYLTQPLPYAAYLSYFIYQVVAMALDAIISMFFTVFAGLAMGYYKSSERKNAPLLNESAESSPTPIT